MSDSNLHMLMWSFDRETEVTYVNRFTDRADYRELCYAVIDAVIEIRETGQIHDHVDTFAGSNAMHFEFVFCCGGKRLVEAARISELAANKLRSIAAHLQWGPRFNVMCLMHMGHQL